ncbi:MAG: hypothetical protein HYU51_16820 [Candidatus Rokubacteria bacterium]|nr:hypothetical protein [Candidatus Rokubacteria bacterium]
MPSPETETRGTGEEATPPAIGPQTVTPARTVALESTAATIADRLRDYLGEHPESTPIRAAIALGIPASQALGDALAELRRT